MKVDWELIFSSDTTNQIASATLHGSKEMQAHVGEDKPVWDETPGRYIYEHVAGALPPQLAILCGAS